MRAGRIIEVGSPQKIYFNADTQFVADFIGRANLVKARVRAQEAARTVVDCGLGAIACARRDLPVDAEVTLCIRPEFIHISGGAASGENVVNGRIDSQVFVGESYESEIRAGSELLLARVDPDAGLKVGDPVNFRLEPAHCLLVAM
jgi:iron(III) transport system ATP-binding protein